MTTVSQEAREAAAALMPMNTMAECEYVVAVKAGKHDGDYRVQAFAKFEQSIRHQAERETLARMEPVAWMPIRTAPRNETMIVLGGEGQQPWVGFFSGWNNYWTTGEVDRSRDHVMHTPQPTHWMPLPPAPEAGQ